MAVQEIKIRYSDDNKGTRRAKVAQYLRRLAEDIEAERVFEFNLHLEIGGTLTGGLGVRIPADYLHVDREVIL